MTSRRELTAEEIHALLSELGARLDATGVHANLYVVGGAAMALVFNSRRVTSDVDGIFEPAEVVAREAAAMAFEHGLETDWLNSRAWTTLDDTPNVYLDVPGLSITTASPEHLLAMKMAAFRDQDQQDLAVLFEVVGIEDPQQAVDITYEAFGGTDSFYADNFGDPLDYALRARAILDILERRKDAVAPGSSRASPATARCSRCNRPLRSGESIRRGMGPSCARR